MKYAQGTRKLAISNNIDVQEKKKKNAYIDSYIGFVAE